MDFYCIFKSVSSTRDDDLRCLDKSTWYWWQIHRSYTEVVICENSSSPCIWISQLISVGLRMVSGDTRWKALCLSKQKPMPKCLSRVSCLACCLAGWMAGWLALSVNRQESEMQRNRRGRERVLLPAPRLLLFAIRTPLPLSFSRVLLMGRFTSSAGKKRKKISADGYGSSRQKLFVRVHLAVRACDGRRRYSLFGSLSEILFFRSSRLHQLPSQ